MEQTLDFYISDFLNYIKFEKRYAQHTSTSYGTDLEQFRVYINEQYTGTGFEEINHTIIRSWLAEMKEKKDTTAKTLNRKISVLKSFYKYLIKNGVVTLSPMAKIISPKNEKRLPVFVKETDIGQLTTAAGTGDTWDVWNTKLLLSLFYTTGMRLTELITLKEGQIDAERRQIKILGKGGKERFVPVTPAVIQSIQDYVAEKKKRFTALPETLLVTEKSKPLYPKYAYLLVKKQLSEIKTLEKKSPHILRHTFATHLMNNGAEINAVKELLGHSSLAATQVYTHNTIEKLKEVYKNAHPKA